MQEGLVPIRFIGLDVHKHYLVAIGVDAEPNQVLSPRRVQLRNLDSWMRGTLTRQDAVASTRLLTNLPLCPIPPLD